MICKTSRTFCALRTVLCFLPFLVWSSIVLAADFPPPPDLEQLKEQDLASHARQADEDPDLRSRAQKDAAFSLGARSGLARRTWEIQQDLESRADDLDAIWRFSALATKTQGNFLMIPAIVVEARDPVALKEGGRTAARSDLALKIIAPARLSLVPPDWRDYLQRTWAREIIPPPALLLPETSAEERLWDDNLELGWQAGLAQADEIHIADIDLLTRDFTGMVLFKRLLAEQRIIAPWVDHEDAGLVGDGLALRIGEEIVRITEDASLSLDAANWLAWEVPAQGGSSIHGGGVSWKP